MANNFNSNTVEDLARVFLEKFEASRCLCKNIDTQLIQGRFTPRTNGEVSVKRPHDYNAIRTAGGNISGETKSDIISGKATATVQDYITVATEWENIEEALEADQIDQILAPMATRAVTTLETSLAAYMRRNAGLSVGTPSTAVDAWSDVAYAGSLMNSLGVPMDNDLYYMMNPYVAQSLASAQSGLNAADGLVRTAWTKAMINDDFAGMSVMSCNTLDTMSDDVNLADRAGTLSAAPTQTYVSVKDTMVQTLAVEGFSANAVVRAGSIVEITGRFYLNQQTRLPFVDNTGSQVKFRGTVTEDVTLDGSGAGNLVITAPAINEANGQYNTVDSALDAGDVVTILGTAGFTAQPNLFFHRQAFGMATVKLPKLYSTDTIATTEDGFSLRVSKYADGDANTQKVRFDLLPAFVTFNPFFAGLGYGQP
jgi:hypothetical protein